MHQKNYHTPKPILKKGEKWKSREELSVDNIDRAIIPALPNEIDAETHFCFSAVGILKKLSPRKNLLPKSKKLSLIVELMDD